MNRIKQLRKEKKMTQDDLATKLHLKRSVISKYENGVIQLTDSLILELTDLFNVTTDYLLGKSNTPTPPIASAFIDEITVKEFLAQHGVTDEMKINMMEDILKAMIKAEGESEHLDELASKNSPSIQTGG